MGLSLGHAAKLTGLGKTTLARAIKPALTDAQLNEITKKGGGIRLS